MATDLQTGSEPSVTNLVTGIINDAQELMKQEFALLKAEIKDDLNKTKQAAISEGIGAAIALVGGLLLGLMLVYLLNWLAPGLPLWGCYGIVGIVFIACGAALLYAGQKKLGSINLLPEQSIQALRENVQWIKNPK
jgi:hypothetical protein